MIAYGIYLQIMAWLWFPLFYLSALWISSTQENPSVLEIWGWGAARGAILTVIAVCLIRVAFLICLLAEQFKC